MKKILILALILGLGLSIFGIVNIAHAQYGFQRLFGVPGLEQASMAEIFVRLISWALGIVGLVCVVYIIYGGITYATSGGNEEKITKGKKILIWSITGLAVCILAFVIANAVVIAFGGR